MQTSQNELVLYSKAQAELALGTNPLTIRIAGALRAAAIALDQAPEAIPWVTLQVVTLQEELHGKVRHAILLLTFPPACGCQASASWTVGSAEVTKNQIETQKLLAPLTGLIVANRAVHEGLDPCHR